MLGGPLVPKVGMRNRLWEWQGLARNAEGGREGEREGGLGGAGSGASRGGQRTRHLEARNGDGCPDHQACRSGHSQGISWCGPNLGVGAGRLGRRLETRILSTCKPEKRHQKSLKGLQGAELAPNLGSSWASSEGPGRMGSGQREGISPSHPWQWCWGPVPPSQGLSARRACQPAGPAQLWSLAQGPGSG